MLVDLGYLSESQLVAALATQIGLPFADLSDYPVDAGAASLLPDAVARRQTALPVGYDDGRLVVAMADPTNVFALDDIRSTRLLRRSSMTRPWSSSSIFMRILDNSTAMIKLADFGFRDSNFRRWATSFTKPYGLLLVTGPTGSGKSTTLYATLNIASKPDINVITVEDPVAYRSLASIRCR